MLRSARGNWFVLCLVPFALAACDFLEDLTGPDEDDESGRYGYVEVWERHSTSWTDRLPDRAELSEPATSSEGSGIGTAASEPRSGVMVMAANVDPDSPCAAVGRTCVPMVGAPTLVSVSLVTPGEGVAQWIAVGGEVTVESLDPMRFRLENLEMRVAPYEGNAASGSFYMRGVVGAGGS